MKKFIYTFLIALSLLGITSCCFASADWGVLELQKFLSCYGYDFDFANANYNNGSYSNLTNLLARENYPLIIFDMRNGGKFFNCSDNVSCDFVLYNAYTGNPASRKLFMTKNSSGDYFYYFEYCNYGFAVDIDTNTVYYGKQWYYTNDYWNEKNLKVSHEEFTSTAFQEYLIKRYGLIYTEATIYANDGKTPLVVPQGGEIKQSSFDNVVYKGKITYGATTETTNITYTSGFTADTNYDLFLEIYKLGDSYDNGITAYPVDTVDLGTVSTSVTSKKIDIKKALSSSFYVYKLCVGKNNFDTSGTNDVYLSTKWLLPNDNTVRRYKDFSRCHTMQFLSLISYEYDYDYDGEESPDNPNNPDNWPLIDKDERPIYFYSGNCLGGYVADSANVFINVKRKNTSVDIEDFYLILDKYSYPEGNKLASYTIESSGDSNVWSISVGTDNLVFLVNLSNYYTFDVTEECYYFLRLHSYTSGYVDSTKAFYFNNSYFIVEDNQQGFVGKLLEGIKGLFLPSSEFMTSYWNELYLFFKVKLGFLWDLVMFFPELINNIISVLKAELLLTSFTTPELSIPTFMGDGSEVVILESITFSPYEYWGQSKVFADLYTLYLNLMDFLVFFALFNYGLVVVAKILGFWVPESSDDSSKKSTKKE